MSIVKKIITGSLEVIRDSTKEVGRIVSPQELTDQLVGKPKSSGNELGQYLEKTADPTLTGDKLKQKEAELEAQRQKELEETRKAIAASPIPAHMKPSPQPPELSIYDQKIREEQQNAQRIEVERKNQSKQLNMPSGKQKAKLGATSRRASTSEGIKKDSRIG